MIKYELLNGETVDLSINMSGILKIQKEKPELYKVYNNILSGKQSDVLLSMLPVIYVSYLCARVDDWDKLHPQIKFYDLMPYDMEEMATITEQLLRPKKTGGSAKPSSTKQKK